MISIIDYELGNVLSVKNAITKIGYDCVITRDENQLSLSDAIILPGVGSYEKGVNNLKKFNLINILNKQVFENKKKILGICLGFQLMCDFSEEFGKYSGLSWLNLKVSKMNSKKLRLPHVGWNKLKLNNDGKFFQNISEKELFYFNHSYCIQRNDDKNYETLAECEYGEKFIAALKFKNIYGIQPHPEKSQYQGLKVLKNFIET
jgi:glutamine amidotransferase